MTDQFLYLTDLDHSLFQSLKADPNGKHPMTVDTDGNPHGFSRDDQFRLFQQMRQSGVVIPVTARSHAQMERVAGWETGMDYDLAITDLGSTLLLRDNKGDKLWHAVPYWHEAYLDAVQKNTQKIVRDYQLIKDVLLVDAGLDASVKVDMISLGKLRLPLYITLSINGDEDSRAGITEFVMNAYAEPMAKMTQNYLLHESDSIICLWPTFVSKGSAVTRLLDIAENGSGHEQLDHALSYLALPSRTVVTVGDSMTDIEFMRHGDFMMAPKGSPISRVLDSHNQKSMKPF